MAAVGDSSSSAVYAMSTSSPMVAAAVFRSSILPYPLVSSGMSASPPGESGTVTAGVVSPTTSGANAATGAACPMSAAWPGSVRSGASHSTPVGGRRSAADAGRPCHTCGSASTTPKLPTPEPP